MPLQLSLTTDTWSETALQKKVQAREGAASTKLWIMWVLLVILEKGHCQIGA